MEPSAVSDDDVEPRAGSVRLLIGAIRRLAAARSLDAVSQIVRVTARALVGADGATFVLRDGDECHYLDEDALAPLWKGQRFPVSACASGWAMRHQEQVVIPNIYADPRVPHDAYRPTFVKSLVITPVRRDPSVAAIGTYWATHRQVTPAELPLLQDLADATAVSLENVAIYADLERRVAERTKELVLLNQELEAFSFSVAHDLRSPLNAISGFAELASARFGAAMPKELDEYMKNIQAGSHIMAQLITSLLAFARCTHQSLTRVNVDLSALARSAMSRLMLEHPGRDVRVEIASGLTARADQQLSEVVLMNLLGNALKYTRDVTPATICLGQVKGIEVPTFYVRDNGAGFDGASADQLFAPFQRFHSSARFDGTGVGLSTVARIVRRHGGEVWAESKPGHGATFFFSLPEAPPLGA